MAAERASYSGKEQQPASSLLFQCLGRQELLPKRCPGIREHLAGGEGDQEDKTMVPFRRLTQIQGGPQSALCNLGPAELLPWCEEVHCGHPVLFKGCWVALL